MSKPSVHEPLIALALAVVARAVKDARSGRRDARAWLKSVDAEVYLNVIGYEPGVVIRWVSGLEESEQNESEALQAV